MRRPEKYPEWEGVLKQIKNSESMMTNSKFEKAARSRRIIALTIALLLHVAIFAALVHEGEFKELLPDFMKELIESDAQPKQEVPVP